MDAWLGRLLELLDKLLALLLALEVDEVLVVEDVLTVDSAELFIVLLASLLARLLDGLLVEVDAAWLDTGDVSGLVEPLPPPQAVKPAAHRAISK